MASFNVPSVKMVWAVMASVPNPTCDFHYTSNHHTYYVTSSHILYGMGCHGNDTKTDM